MQRSAEAAGGRSEVRKSGTVCADGPDADGPDKEESSSLELLERCPWGFHRRVLNYYFILCLIACVGTYERVAC